MTQNNEKKIYDYADKFINIANEIAQADRSGTVGMAIRFAAARFSVFEASTQTADLAADRDKYLQLIKEDFARTLEFNYDEYIKLLAQK